MIYCFWAILDNKIRDTSTSRRKKNKFSGLQKFSDVNRKKNILKNPVRDPRSDCTEFELQNLIDSEKLTKPGLESSFIIWNIVTVLPFLLDLITMFLFFFVFCEIRTAENLRVCNDL